ncbi:MAG: chemotaxis protein CheD [bacterium]
MSGLILGIGDYGASNKPGSYVKTLALGSCIAVVLLDSKTHTVGMVHVALPEAKISPDKAASKPGYFADTGIPILLKQMAALGCNANGKGLLVKLAGGAQILDPSGVFNIGKRNLLAVKKFLWKHRLGAVAEDVGGTISRTVTVEIDTGKVTINSAGRGSWVI